MTSFFSSFHFQDCGSSCQAAEAAFEAAAVKVSRGLFKQFLLPAAS
jgi:hypothetical protein